MCQKDYPDVTTIQEYPSALPLLPDPPRRHPSSGEKDVGTVWYWTVARPSQVWHREGRREGTTHSVVYLFPSTLVYVRRSSVSGRGATEGYPGVNK